MVKQLRRNSIRLPAIGQGLGEYSWQDSQIEIIRLGVSLGMNLLDTAEIYDKGRSEEIIGKAVKGMRDKVVIATKFSPEHSSFDAVVKAAEGSLRRLNTDYIDLYQMHWPNPNVPAQETWSALQRLLKDGKVRHIGLGNVYGQGMKEFRSLPGGGGIATLQTEYNLFNRSIEEEILPYCEQEKILVIAYSPLDHGRWQRDGRRKQALEEIAKKYDRTPSQIALRWLICKPCVVVIPKTSNREHLKENAAAADFDLKDEDVTFIDDIFRQIPIDVPPERIYEKTCGTLEEALKNKAGYVPSPAELARTIVQEKAIKPVRLAPRADKTGKYEYDLVEGRLRYWAWVIAHQGKVPIRAFVNDP